MENITNTLAGFFNSDFFTRDIEFNAENILNATMVLLLVAGVLAVVGFVAFLIYAVASILISGFGVGSFVFGSIVFGGIASMIGQSY